MLINHVNGVQIRVTGSGVLQSRLLAQAVNGVQPEKILADLDMDSITTPFSLIKANYKKPKAQYYFFTSEIDEYFEIEQITIFIKPVATSYPK